MPCRRYVHVIETCQGAFSRQSFFLKGLLAPWRSQRTTHSRHLFPLAAAPHLTHTRLRRRALCKRVDPLLPFHARPGCRNVSAAAQSLVRLSRHRQSRSARSRGSASRSRRHLRRGARQHRRISQPWRRRSWARCSLRQRCGDERGRVTRFSPVGRSRSCVCRATPYQIQSHFF